MDDLDKQLAELELLNNQELKPNPQGTLSKKVGPAVPPKPKKNLPQVPISCTVKTVCEPSYSTRLQNVNPNLYSNVPPPNVESASPHGMVAYAPKGYNRNDYVTYSNIQVGARNHSPQQDKLIYSNLMHPPAGGAGIARDGNGSNFYSNLPPAGGGINNMYANGGHMEDLPPPPLELAAGDYAPCSINTNFPPPPEELPPPPSPVSSSYSELRRATDTEYPLSQDYGTLGSQYSGSESYYGYGPSSQSSSTYESIYEPINPRPPSQMSSRSNYSLYAPYVSGTQSGGATGQAPSRMSGVKEEEVDALTDLLVHSMGGTGEEPDCYGICVKCREKVIGENNGCTAMEQVYHTGCFTCHNCAINLQGKPFYALDGKPFCEEDYLNTLEKCSVCMKPILDRILRATGKPYHPKCFTCVICGKSLDGIPFTVDATNQIHCIEDFHKKFAPRCCVCKQPIMPEPGQDETVRVVALDRSFHINCYKCEDCGLVLSSEAEGRGCYPLDDHVLCKSCNAKRVQALTSHMTTEL